MIVSIVSVASIVPNSSSILNLNKSKTRFQLLRLYFSNPQKRYYLRQLEKLLGLSVGNIRRELRQLEQTGLFIAEKESNLSYYSLNRQHILYKELKSIIFKTIGIEGELGKIIGKDDGIIASFIFGSFASGSEDKERDVDLYLIVDQKKFDENRLVKNTRNLEKDTGREINYHYIGLDEFTKKKKSNSFVRSILKGKKIILKRHECLD